VAQREGDHEVPAPNERVRARMRRPSRSRSSLRNEERDLPHHYLEAAAAPGVSRPAQPNWSFTSAAPGVGAANFAVHPPMIPPSPRERRCANPGT
jgi:hypothetical protein